MDPPSAVADRESPDPVSSSLMYGFKLGDMVWGKVKSHPWWPGHIFNEAFASPSVRRSKREGHVLVAFYGDSSYGWFDPEELIHFDAYYPEKSRQTVSRTFTKAVDEALDELRRRGALAVTCYCRNLNNFRPVSVPRYLAVDVPGFEMGGIYSADFIKASRESFAPKVALSFVKDSALSFTTGKFNKTANWIKSCALLLAIRKAWYEEYDDTYAEAFGVVPVRPPKDVPGLLDQPFRDTLSGPLRIAEALGDNKSSSKQKSRSGSASSSSKKNKYLLKRRGETPSSSPPLPDLPPISNAVKPPQFPPDSVNAKPASTAIQSSSSAKTSKADNYVFQKRQSPPEKSQPVPEPKQANSKPPGYEFISDLAHQLDLSEPPPGFSNGSQSTVHLNSPSSDAVSTPLKLNSTVDTADANLEERPPAIDSNNSTELEQALVLATVVPDVGPKEEKVQESGARDLRKNKREPKTTSEVTCEVRKVDLKNKKRELENITGVIRDKDNSVLNKKKREPESITDLTHDTAGYVAKKKKREPESITELTLDDSSNLKKKKTIKRKLESITNVTEIARDDQSRRKARPEVIQPQTVSLPTPDFDSPERELSQVLSDLSGLAMDPFYGAEYGAPDIVRHVFLRFRNRVYQKSLVLPTDDEGPADVKDGKDQRGQKPLKPLFKSDDPTKSGRKRGPSDRQEELSEKRTKKLDRLKGLANEKKTGLTLRAPEEPSLSLQGKPETVKKHQEPRIPHPTYLVLKFLQRISLPSVATLKAKFARFGTIDGPATRVFWKTYTCKVLFLYKSDAEDACSYASSNDLFGQVKVKYSVREVDPPADVPPAEPQFRPGNINGNGAPVHYPRLSTGPLKSAIKRRRVDEAGPSTAANVRKKVYFMLSNNAIIGHGGDVLPLPPPAPPRPDQVQNPVIVRLGSPPGGPTDPRPRPRPHAYISPPPPAAPEVSQYPLPDPSIQPYRQQLLPQPQAQAQPLPSQMPVSLPPSPQLSSQMPVSLPPLLAPMSQMPVSLPPLPAPISVSFPPVVAGGLENPPSVHSEAEPSRPLGSGNEDITTRMMSLLLRCNSIVANVLSSPGYVRYSRL